MGAHQAAERPCVLASELYAQGKCRPQLSGAELVLPAPRIANGNTAEGGHCRILATAGSCWAGTGIPLTENCEE